jgi:hypothetical protein
MAIEPAQACPVGRIEQQLESLPRFSKTPFYRGKQILDPLPA